MNDQRQSSIENIISASEMSALHIRVRWRILYLLFVVLLVLVLVGLISFQVIAEKEMDKAAMTSRGQLEAIRSLQQNDLVFLETLVFQLAADTELQRFVTTPTDLSRELILDNWMRVAERVSWIFQIRLIARSGYETLRVDYDRESGFAQDVDSRQNKRDRDYFRQAIDLEQNQIYVSPINLNREYGELSYPLTPVLRMAVPVIQPSGQSSGILVVNFFADKLLDVLSQVSAGARGETLLLNGQGEFLQGYSGSDSWSHELTPGDSKRFMDLYPALWEMIVRAGNGEARQEDERFLFRTLEIADDGVEQRRYYLLRHITKSDISAEYEEQTDRLYFIFASLLIISLLITWAYYYNRLSREIEHQSLDLISVLFRSREAVLVTNGEWRIKLVNDAFCEMTGFSHDDVADKPCGELCFIDQPGLVDEIEDSIDREGYWSGEVESLGKDGGHRTSIVFASAIRSKQGLITRYVIQLVDITDRKHMETELSIAAAAFQTRQAISITDAEGNIIRVNDAFTEITGYSPDEVVGENPRILSSGRHDKSFYENLWSEINARGFWQGEIWNRHKDGKIFPEWIRISSISNRAGEVIHYVATFEDITERKELEDRLKSLS
ncbi:MAG: PAS domain S-box protein [Gammaproteobacteria bacterium]|nr:PAS domain S-box protein [Gammaproteobacteria bacterium]